MRPILGGLDSGLVTRARGRVLELLGLVGRVMAAAVLILVVVVFVIFAIENRQQVRISWLWWHSARLPLWLPVGLAAVASTLLTYLGLLPSRIRSGWHHARLTRLLAMAEGRKPEL